MSFETAPPVLARALEAKGYTTPTPVQAALLDPALAGRDLCVSARTGSGKTVGFGLLLADALLEAGSDGRRERAVPSGAPLALVVAPTRELAIQVQRELTWLYGPSGARVTACVGGMDIGRQLRALRSGAQVVVGTPGRLCDLLDRRALDLSKLRVAVLDEADEMLDLGFRDELTKLLDACPAERRTLMFSATLPPAARALAETYQRDAQYLSVATEEAHADITYQIAFVSRMNREAALVNLLRFHEPPSALVFVATREGAATLHASLVERGFGAALLSGELGQGERTRSLQALRDGRARVLVATDVAARGLDLPTLDLVIHWDLPNDPAVLLHRSGRTGRAGRKGRAVLLVPAGRRQQVSRMLQAAGIEAERSAPPSAADVAALDQQRLLQECVPTEEPSEEDREVARRLLAEHDAEKLVAAWVQSRRSERPAPEEPLPAMPERPYRPADVRGGRDRRPGADRPDRDGGERRPSGPGDRRPAAPGGRGKFAWKRDAVWFAVNVGQDRRADPRWLLPLLCRRGQVDRDAIGTIKVGKRETRFEVHPDAAERFEQAVAQPDDDSPELRIGKV